MFNIDNVLVSHIIIGFYHCKIIPIHGKCMKLSIKCNLACKIFVQFSLYIDTILAENSFNRKFVDEKRELR